MEIKKISLRRLGLLLLITFNFLFLSACAIKPRITNHYFLDTVPCDVPRKSTRNIILLVQQPTARPLFDTREMVYRRKCWRMAYFSRSDWAETPAEMLYPLLVQTLQDTHFFKQIVMPPYFGPYQYVLDTHIIDLYMDFTGCKPCFVITVRAQISKMPSAKVIATRQFTLTQPFYPPGPCPGVYIGNQLTAKLLKEIALFAIKVTG